MLADMGTEAVGKAVAWLAEAESCYELAHLAGVAEAVRAARVELENATLLASPVGTRLLKPVWDAIP